MSRPKALHYYWLAAAGGHAQAQYRYAKLLLTSRRQPDPHEWSAAVRLLELSAASGLTEVAPGFTPLALNRFSSQPGGTLWTAQW